jgi:ABC-type microcin C transport system permease subunit YejE
MVLYANDTNILVEYRDKNVLTLKLDYVMKQLNVWFLNNKHILNIT